jgi:hypothetical protein
MWREEISFVARHAQAVNLHYPLTLPMACRECANDKREDFFKDVGFDL